jgi:hypothetical protein
MPKNLTMGDIMTIVQEEMDLVNGNGQRYGVPQNWVKKLQELGPETGHEPGTDPVEILQAIAADLEGIMQNASSTTTASEFAGFIRSKSEEVTEALDELIGGVK